MKKIAFIILTGIMLMLAGCGSEASIAVTVPIPAPVYVPPSITAMQFKQDTVQFFILGSIDFNALDTDLGDITVIAANSSGQEVIRTITDLESFAEQTAGTIPFSLDYINLVPGSYTFTVFLTDMRGLMSNPVYGTFAVP